MDSGNLITFRPCTFATLATLSILSLSHAQSGATSADQEPDPWFEESRAASEDAEDQKPVRSPSPKRNARALHRKLITQYERIEENNITQRIRILEEAKSIAPNLSKNHQQILADLKHEKTGVLSAIQYASKSSTKIEEGLKALGPYTRYFIGDTTLAIALIDSPLIDKIESRIRILGHRGEFEAIDQLADSIRSSDLNRILAERIDTQVRATLANFVERHWDSSSGAFQALAGEAFLIGCITESEDKKLSVQLDFPHDADQRLKNSIQRSMEHAWSKDFQFGLPDQRSESSDLILKVSLDEIQMERQESATQVSSQILGAITEEPNLEFIAMAEKYEAAAKRYEAEMINYEQLYQLYLEGYDNSNYENAQRDVRQAEQAVKDAGRFGPVPSELVAQAQIAKSIAGSISSNSALKPIEPVPYHQEVLEQLYLIPSTLITEIESIPYQYTSKNIKYVFSSRADLALSSPVDKTIKFNGNAALQQERGWTKNEGVHPKDPSADPGTYSEAGFDSAVDLFRLEFGTSLSEEFGTLLGKVRTPAPTALRDREDLETLLLRLSLAARSQDGDPYSLSNDELKELAAMARSPDSSSKEFRLACLDHILRKSGLADSIPVAKLETLL